MIDLLNMDWVLNPILKLNILTNSTIQQFILNLVSIRVPSKYYRLGKKSTSPQIKIE